MPVQLAVVTEQGVQEFIDAEVGHTGLKELVDLWKAKEVESLGQLAPRPGGVAIEPPPEDGLAVEVAPSIDVSDIKSA